MTAPVARSNRVTVLLPLLATQMLCLLKTLYVLAPLNLRGVKDSLSSR
jgi:hypothetical protein